MIGTVITDISFQVYIKDSRRKLLLFKQGLTNCSLCVLKLLMLVDRNNRLGIENDEMP